MKTLGRVIGALLCIIFILVIVAGALFFNELRSLASLQKVDDYPMYRMTYYGDYGFDGFLKTGAKNDGDIEAYVTKRLLKGLPIDLGVTGDGCTAFVTHNADGDVIFGRNFDFDYTPSLQVYTDPDNGYASVSTVNLAFAGYTADKLPAPGISMSGFLTLAAPYLPFDGMNEKGVAIALLAVPEAQPPTDKDVTLNTTTAIRLVLDKAATADEAVELLKNYNIYFSADVDCHFLIADSSGASVLVEYWDGEMVTTKPDADTDYQIASNFIAYNGMNKGEGYDEFERYDAVKERIETNGGVLSESDAAALLAEIGVRDGDEDKLQWSAVYNLTDLDGRIFAHRNTDNVMNFKMED
jgi:hypothetical protein